MNKSDECVSVRLYIVKGVNVMEKLSFDLGIREFRINNSDAYLRFNPSDPNVYNRFLKIPEKIEAIEHEMSEKVSKLQENDGAGALEALSRADAKSKEVLNDVFELGNDFNQIMQGINIMAAGANGKRIIINLFEALLPIFEDGAQKCADAKLETAKANREQRRAATRK